MDLFSIALRNAKQRGLSTMLTTISLALGVGLVVLVLSIHGIVSDAFRRNATVGYNLVIGAKGSPLQLTLNTVYYLSQPVENLPYSYFLEFFSQGERERQLREYGGYLKEPQRDGKFSLYTSGGLVIPVCLGDYHGPFRVVGTTPDFLNQLKHGPNVDLDYEFAEGRNFETHSEENGFFEAVVGSRVAAEMGVKVGDHFNPTHGDPEGAGHNLGFTIVGVMKPTGTPNDRATFVNMEGFYLMEGHAKSPGEDEVPEEPAEVTADVPDEVSDDSSDEGASSNESAEEAGDESGDNGETVDDATETTAGHAEDTENAPGSPDNDSESPEEAVNDSGEATETSDVAAEDTGEVAAETTTDPEVAVDDTERKPLPINQREVTAILLRPSQAMWAMMMQNVINEGIQAQAATPIGEISKLMDQFVNPIRKVLLLITVITCFVAGVGILVSIYNSMNDRRRDIAVMRALGARRSTVMWIILLESGIISVAGGLIGWVAAHGAIAFFSKTIEEQTGVPVTFFSMSNWEIIVIPFVLGLAALSGFLPAMMAYRTDVSKSLAA